MTINATALMQIQRQQERINAVLDRQLFRYDYEKVVTNAGYQILFVGLGWIAVKSGFLFGGLQDEIDNVLEIPEVIALRARQQLIATKLSQIDSEYKPPLWWSIWQPIRRLADPLGIWEYILRPSNDSTVIELKQEYKDNAARLDVLTAIVEIKPTPFNDILLFLDGLYATYGTVAPIFILIGNAFLELNRVKKLREIKELNQTETI